MGFIRCIETYLPERQTKFTTHIYNTVSGHLKNSLRSVVGRTKDGSFAPSDSLSYQIASPTTNFGSGFHTDNDENAWSALASNNIEEVAYGNLLAEEIENKLEDESMRKVFLLRLEGLSIREICEETGLDTNKVFNYLSCIQSVTAQTLANS